MPVLGIIAEATVESMWLKKMSRSPHFCRDERDWVAQYSVPVHQAVALTLTLDAGVSTSYRPISNLPSFSKTLESYPSAV